MYEIQFGIVSQFKISITNVASFEEAFHHRVKILLKEQVRQLRWLHTRYSFFFLKYNN